MTGGFVDAGDDAVFNSPARFADSTALSSSGRLASLPE